MQGNGGRGEGWGTCPHHKRSSYLETERMCVQGNGGRGWGVGVRVYTINAQTELETKKMCVQGNSKYLRKFSKYLLNTITGLYTS